MVAGLGFSSLGFSNSNPQQLQHEPQGLDLPSSSSNPERSDAKSSQSKPDPMEMMAELMVRGKEVMAAVDTAAQVIAVITPAVADMLPNRVPGSPGGEPSSLAGRAPGSRSADEPERQDMYGDSGPHFPADQWWTQYPADQRWTQYPADQWWSKYPADQWQWSPDPADQWWDNSQWSPDPADQWPRDSAYQCQGVGPAQAPPSGFEPAAGLGLSQEIDMTVQVLPVSGAGQGRTICALGMTGDGKSTTLNTLSKTSIFNTKHDGLNSCTNTLSVEKLQWLGHGDFVSFVDTPGYGDTYGDDLKILHDVQQKVAEEIKIVDAFVVVIKYATVFHKHVVDMLRSYQVKFGSGFVDSLIIVVTYWRYNDDPASSFRSKQHQGQEGMERYEHDMTRQLQKALKVENEFEFVFMDNMRDQNNEEVREEFNKQVSKLWSFTSDTSHTFDGERLELIHSVDTSDFSPCSCPGCPNPGGATLFWQQCSDISCAHFGEIYHYDCWRRVHHNQLPCKTGKVFCEKSFHSKYAHNLAVLEDLIKDPTSALTAGASSLDVMIECVSQHGAEESVHGVDTLVDFAETLGDFANTLGHCAFHILAPVVGGLIAWRSYQTQRMQHCDQLALHYGDPMAAGALSPEEFAIKTVAAHRALEFRNKAALAMTALGIAGTAAIGVATTLLPFWIAFAVLSCAVRFGARKYGQKKGETEARLAIQKSHWSIVAQCLSTLELDEFVRGPLEGNAAKLDWGTIRSYYLDAARSSHPDKVSREDLCSEEVLKQKLVTATAKFVQIQSSYEILQSYHNSFRENNDAWMETLQNAYKLCRGGDGWAPASNEDVRKLLAEREGKSLEHLDRELSSFFSPCPRLASTRAEAARKALDDKPKDKQV